MSVRWELNLVVEVAEGSEPTATEASLIEHIGWLNGKGPHTSAWHEVMAQLSVMMARSHWRDADTYARIERRAADRRRKAAEREKA